MAEEQRHPARGQSKRRQPARRQPGWFGGLLIIVAAAVWFVVLLSSAVVGLLHTSWGLEQAQGQLESLVSGEIPGNVQVASLEEPDFFSPAGMFRARANGIVFTNSEGAEVVRVPQADIAFDLRSLLSREVHFEEAEIAGGTVTLEPGAHGVTKLENAFNDPGPSKPDQRKGKAPFGIDLRAMHVQDMTLDVTVDSKEFVIDQIEGFVGIFKGRSAEGVTVKFDEMSARMSKPAYLGDTTEFPSLDGKVRGKQKQVVDLDFVAKLAGGNIDGNFAFFPKRKKKVTLTLEPGGAVVSVASFAANLRTELGGGVVIDLK